MLFLIVISILIFIHMPELFIFWVSVFLLFLNFSYIYVWVKDYQKRKEEKRANNAEHKQ